MESIWAIEPTYLRKYLEQTENASAEDKKKAFELYSSKDFENEILLIQGDTAYITIKGRLINQKPSYISRMFGFGATLYQDIIDATLTILGQEQIKEVRLIMDTPGGAVDMVDETYQAIRELSKSKKVIAISTGMVASAGYWLASAANEIWATAPTNEFGSIGVVIAYTSWKKADEEYGIKEIVIVSKNAPKKAPDIDTQAGRDVIQDRIDATERIFIARISEGRSVAEDKIIKDFGQGGLLIAKDPDDEKPDAMSTGMIDSLRFEAFATGGSNKKKKGLSLEADQPGGISPDTLADDSQGTGSSLSGPDIDSPVDSSQANNGGENKNKNNKKSEVLTMELFAFLQENPGAKAQFDAHVEKTRNEGSQSGADRVEARIKKVIPFLTADYPDALKTLAVKVLSGDSEFAALEGAVTIHDSTKEAATSAAAKTDTTAAGETPPDGTPAVSQDGSLQTEEDFAAAVARTKDVRGQ